MSIVLDDDRTATLIEELVALSGMSEQDAVRHAVQAEVSRLRAEIPLSERLRRLREAYPLPPPTGLPADKAFFDELSGDL